MGTHILRGRADTKSSGVDGERVSQRKQSRMNKGQHEGSHRRLGEKVTKPLWQLVQKTANKKGPRTMAVLKDHEGKAVTDKKAKAELMQKVFMGEFCGRVSKSQWEEYLRKIEDNKAKSEELAEGQGIAQEQWMVMLSKPIATLRTGKMSGTDGVPA